MKRWPSEAIEDLKSRPGVDGKAVEGFLASMGSNRRVAIRKLWRDASQHAWNAATINAIRDGIDLVLEEELSY